MLMQAQGKSGLLFNLEKNDKEENVYRDKDPNLAKVMIKHYYELNKHIYPYSKYEILGATKETKERNT